TQRSPVIKELVQSERVRIMPAVYSLATGKVEWPDTKAVAGGTKPREGIGTSGVTGGGEAPRATSIQVRVPSTDARVWIDGRETSSRGLSRTYDVPALPAGRKYEYHIKATWNEGGRTVTR